MTASTHRSEPFRSTLVGGLLLAWALPSLAIGAVLMAGHWVELPAPDREDPAFQAQFQALQTGEMSEWTLVHVLYTECRCSQKIFDYLFERPHPPQTQELVLLVGPPKHYAADAKAAGFRTIVVTKTQLKERFQIESAPLLLVLNPDRQARYVGGYTGRKQGADYRDLQILAELQRGKSTDELPLYGCGVSKELQAYLDPIGLKYRDADVNDDAAPLLVGPPISLSTTTAKQSPTPRLGVR